MYINIDKIKSKLKMTDFYRIYVEDSFRESFFIKNGELEDINELHSFGLSIFYVKDKFGYFYSTNDINKLNNFEITSANKLPKTMNYNPVESYINKKVVIGKKSNISLEDLSNEYIKYTKKDSQLIASVESKYSYRIKKINILSENTNISQEINYSSAGVNVTAKKGDIIRDDSKRDAITSALNKDAYKFVNVIEESKYDAAQKLSYKSGIKGKFNVIIDPHVADVLAHEAIGHAAESDAIYNNYSVLKGKLKKTVAPSYVTIVDDPTPKDDLFGSYSYDDEGFEAVPRKLIKNGKVNEYLTSSKYAQLLKTDNNGSSRSESYSSMPIPRMSNTSFLNGNIKLDKMIEELDDGLMLTGSSGGETDPGSGIFQFGIDKAYRVVKGELQEGYVDIGISGNILSTLKDIKCLSKEIKTKQPGICGKDGQSVPVGGFSPYVRIDNVRIG